MSRTNIGQCAGLGVGAESALPMGEVRALPVRARATAYGILTVFLASPVVADTDERKEFVQTVDQCLEIIEIEEDARAARLLIAPLVDEIEETATRFAEQNRAIELSPELNSTAAECVAFARQIRGGLLFSLEQGRYLSAEAVRAVEAAALQELERQQEALEAAARVAAELAEAERQRILNAEIALRVNQACEALAREDSVAAYTNEACIESFRQNGLPDE